MRLNIILVYSEYFPWKQISLAVLCCTKMAHEQCWVILLLLLEKECDIKGFSRTKGSENVFYYSLRLKQIDLCYYNPVYICSYYVYIMGSTYSNFAKELLSMVSY